MNKFDLNKPVQTRDGRAARIICTDACNRQYPIVALVAQTGGRELPLTFTTEGLFEAYREGGSEDLVNVPENIKGHYWVNLYEAPNSPCLHPSKEEANTYAAGKRVACIEWVFSVPKGTGL